MLKTTTDPVLSPGSGRNDNAVESKEFMPTLNRNFSATSKILTSQNKLMTVRKSDGTNAAVARGISVEEIKVESAPNGDDAALAAGEQVLSIAGRRHTQDIVLVSTVPDDRKRRKTENLPTEKDFRWKNMITMLKF